MALLGAAFLASPSSAGGLYVNEFATKAQGAAGAGGIAWASDASITLLNPAGMTELDDHEAAIGLQAIFGRVEFDASSNSPGDGGDGGNQAGLAPVASASYVHRLTDRLRFGMGFFSISGSILDPNDGWQGRFEVTEISLLTMSVSPTLAYRVNDWLSVGGGPIITYGRLEWDLKVPVPGEPKAKIDVDDVRAAARAGIFLKPHEDLDVGVYYQSETELQLDGDVDIPAPAIGSVGLGLDLDLAQLVRVGFNWRATDRLSLLGTFGWEDWSTLDTIPVSTARGSLSAPLGFKDTYKVLAGVHYRLRDDWLLQTGFGWDSSPLDGSDRTTALPIDQQFRFALGAIHDLTDTIDLGLNFVYANLGESRVRQPTVRGKYETNHVFVLGATLSFGKLPWSGMGSFD
jgi:long-chain fatty acid transport protein